MPLIPAVRPPRNPIAETDTGTVTQEWLLWLQGLADQVFALNNASPPVPPIFDGVTGSGTAGRIAKWLATKELTNSIISESGTVVTIDGSLIVASGIGGGGGGTGAAGATGPRGPQGPPGVPGLDADDAGTVWPWPATSASASVVFTTGSVIFAGPSGALAQDNANFFWNDATNQLVIGGSVAWNGSTATCPALYRSVAEPTTLRVRLADDTAFTSLKAGELYANSNNAGGGFMMLGGIAADRNYGGIWIGQATPGFGNYCFLANSVGGQVFFNSPGGPLFDIEFRIQNVTHFTVGNAGVMVNGTPNTAPTRPFAVSNAANTSTLMVIENAGNVGIGTTSPANLLSLGLGGTTRGELNFAGNTSGVLVMRGPSTASGTLTWPAGTTDFSATGGTGQYVKQSSVGAALTVGTLTAADISSALAFTQGSVVFAGVSGALSQDNANFFWDNTNKRLGIGTTPSYPLHIVSNVGEEARFDGISTYVGFAISGTPFGYVGHAQTIVSGGSAVDFAVRSQTGLHFATGGSASRMYVTSTGEVGIGVSTSLTKRVTIDGAISFIGSSSVSRGIIGPPTWATSWIALQNSTLAESTGNYALAQSPTGGTLLNSASGQTLDLRINNGTVLTIAGANVGITDASTFVFPASGTYGLFFKDGTAPGTLTADSAGFFANDVSGTVHMFAVSEANVTMQLTGAANNTLATAVQDNITRLGTIATGVWNGTAIGPTFGGTGLTSYTTGDVLYASATNVLSKLAATTNGFVLTLAAGVPAWAAASSVITGAALTKVDDTNVTLTLGGSPTTALLAATSITVGWAGTLSVARGGTGTAGALTQGSVVFAGLSGIYAQDNANFFWDDANNRLGIGTAAPSNPLSVVGTTGIQTISVRNTAAGTANGARVTISQDAADVLNLDMYSSTYTTSGYQVASGAAVVTAGAGGMSIGGIGASSVVRFYAGGSTERMRIFTSGAIGLLTTADPSAGRVSIGGSATLQMTPDTSTNASAVKFSPTAGNMYVGADSSAGSSFGFGAYGLGLWTDVAAGITFGAAHASGAIQFQTGGSSERMRIFASGGIAIGGTTDPGNRNVAMQGGGQTKTQAYDGIYINPNAAAAQIAVEDNTGVEGGMFSHGGTATFYMGSWSNHPISFRANNTDRWGINAAGDLTFGASAHIAWSNGTPTGSTNFGNATIAGTDYAFVVTSGTTTTYPVTIAFGHTFSNAPIAVINVVPSGGTVPNRATVTTTTTTCVIDRVDVTGVGAGSLFMVQVSGY